jgi:hypothetical protein
MYTAETQMIYFILKYLKDQVRILSNQNINFGITILRIDNALGNCQS